MRLDAARLRSVPFLLLALGLFLPAGAGALPLVGDDVRIAVTSSPDLAAAGVEILAPFDALGRVRLPVVGGDLHFPLLVGTIELGDSIQLSRNVEAPPFMGNQGGSFLGGATLENLVIDLTALTVAADVHTGLVAFSGGSIHFGRFAVDDYPDLPLFDLRLCVLSTGTDPCFDSDGSLLLNGFGMAYTDAFAAVLEEWVGGGFAQGGGTFGVAYLDVRPVPEPGTALLVGTGLALAALARRRS
jgi:hypothetical protein